MPGSADLMEGMAALDSAVPTYAARWRYYAGDLPEHFASLRIKALIEGSAEAYRFRLARIPVETLANRVQVASVTASNSRANAAIEAIRQANDMELQEPFVIERMLVFGDAYLMALPVEVEDMDDEDRPVDADTAGVGVEIAYQSPMSCRAMYDGEDGRHVRYVIRRWQEDWALGKVWRAEVWYAEHMESWVTQPGAKGTDPQEWLPYAEDETGRYFPPGPGEWPEPHDFGEIPIKHARSDLPYGRSELEDFAGAQNAITKATATQASSIESHGWPERYKIADDKAIIEQARDTVPWGDEADAPKARTVPVSGRAAGPGVEHTYHGTKAVGEFKAPDIGLLIEPVEAWIRWGAAATSTPLFEFDARTGQQMSGTARERAERPLRAKEADRKRFLVRFFREVYALALDHVGISDFGEIEIQWAPPEVVSDPEWWATAQIRRGFGIPEEHILGEANYTPEQIKEWREQADEGLLLDSRIARMQALGEAMQTLGAGATLLGVPTDVMTKLITQMLGDLVPGPIRLEEKEVPPQLDPGADDDEEKEEGEPAPALPGREEGAAQG